MLHDYLHCLVFKEQSCLALLSKCLSLQATHLSYRIQISLSRTFLKFFWSFSVPHSGLPIKACWAVSLPCLSATCIILHESEGIVNTFFEKNRKSLRGVRGTRRRKGAGITFACLDKLVKRDRKSSPPPPSSISARRCKRLCKSHKAQKLVMFFVTFDKPV